MSDEHIIRSEEKLPEYLVDSDTWKLEGKKCYYCKCEFKEEVMFGFPFGFPDRYVPDKKVWFCESCIGELLMFLADLDIGFYLRWMHSVRLTWRRFHEQRIQGTVRSTTDWETILAHFRKWNSYSL